MLETASSDAHMLRPMFVRHVFFLATGESIVKTKEKMTAPKFLGLLLVFGGGIYGLNFMGSLNESHAVEAPPKPTIVEIKGALWHIILTQTGESVSGKTIFAPAGSGSSLVRYEGTCFGKKVDGGYILAMLKGSEIVEVVHATKQGLVTNIGDEALEKCKEVFEKKIE